MSWPLSKSRYIWPGDFAKRLMDLFLASTALLLLAPVLVVVAAFIKAGDGGPVFYRGVRIGRGRRSFRMFKFRTMVVNAEKIGGVSTADDDRRITRIGQFLRKRKIDELPQLINVMLGQMSLVGPRPQVAAEVARYAPEDLEVFTVLPGMTDPASLRFRNEGEILKGEADPDAAYWRLIHPEKMRLARAYVRNRSLRTDLRLVLATAGAVLGLVVPLEDAEGYATITEQWGMAASPQQFSMAYTRYRWAMRVGEGKRLLEVGCGTGMGLRYLAPRMAQAVGGDIEESNLREARLHERSLPWIRLDAHRLPFRNGSFDVILLFEAVYYLKHPEWFLEECLRVLSPGGAVMLSMPNPERPGFNASPFSTRYPTVSSVERLFVDAGLASEVYAGFPVDAGGLVSALKNGIRRLMVGLGLVPKTMVGKALVKRLLFRNTHVFGGIVDGMAPEGGLIRVPNDQAARDFINLYAIGRRPN